MTALVLSFSVAGALLTAAPPEASAYQGTVVDGDTGEPLERAVVVVIWHRSAVTVDMVVAERGAEGALAHPPRAVS